MDAEYLKECFDYDGKNGVIRWKARPLNHFGSVRGWKVANSRAGKIAGHKGEDSRYTLGISGVTYLAHRMVAILCGHNLDDSTVVVMLDGDTFNLKEDNIFVTDMRDVAIMRESMKENDEKCIYKKPKGNYEVSIKIKGKILYGGVFDDIDDAKKARNDFFKFIYA